MKIEKVLNNNVVVALDENGAETVLMGRGLGFGRRAGDEAPPDKVEKRFTLHSDQLSDRFQQLITSIPLPHFLMSERIINHAKIALGKELSDSIYVTLPDHISAAVNRYKEGIVLPNPLLWDIRQLYKDEFRVGLKANEIVKEETGVEFTEDEAAFIALHFVNAQLGGASGGNPDALQVVVFGDLHQVGDVGGLPVGVDGLLAANEAEVVARGHHHGLDPGGIGSEAGVAHCLADELEFAARGFPGDAS